MRQIVEADLTWTGEQFLRDVQIVIDDDGRIESAGELGLTPTRRLTGQALLPGFVSAHSHAFQRALRGRGETFPSSTGTFWSWREAMYALVTTLDAQRFYDVVHATFREMLAAGITTVGEFHYLHHSPGSSDYAFDEIVLQAARDAGIRLVLLMTYYKTGAIGQPLAPAQKRFETRTLDELWRQIDALASKLTARTQSIGVAAHSIRGVPLEEIAPLHAEARRRGMPFHMHVEEQQREIEECMSAYGLTPMQLFNQRLESCEGFTAVHATHSDSGEMKRFLSRGGSVCITPLTEANLGDGIPELTGIVSRPDRLSLGSDSNARISMIDEMRWLEYAQRLKSETRGVFRDENGRCGPRLLQCATTAGAQALGVSADRIAAGAWADFMTVDLGARTIAGIEEENLLDAVIFGATDDAVRATCVAGRWKEHR